MWRQAICVLVVMLLYAVPAAAELKGARSVFERAATSAKGQKKPNDAKSPAEQYEVDLKTYYESAADLSTEIAAKEWLALFDQLPAAQKSWQLEERSNRWSGSSLGYESVSFQGLVAVLPPPSHWPTLIKAIEARPIGEGRVALRERAIKLVAHMLASDGDAIRRDAEALIQTIAASEDAQIGSRTYQMEGLLALVVASANDKEAIRRSFERQLDRVEKESDGSYLQVPDLVTLLGKDEAEKLLRRALALPIQLWSMDQGDQTLALSRKLALEMIDTLAVARWELVTGIDLDTIRLFEAMDKRFGGKDKETLTNLTSEVLIKLDSESLRTLLESRSSDMFGSGMFGSGMDGRANARIYYFMALVANGRIEDAVQFAKASKFSTGSDGLPSNTLAALDKAGFAGELFDLFHKLLTDDPDLPYWGAYTSLAARVGRTDDMLALASKAAAEPNVTPQKRFKLLRHLQIAQLAADRIDEGIRLLHEAIKLLRTVEGDDTDWGDSTFSLGGELVSLGRVLKRDPLIQEGIAIMSTPEASALAANAYAGNQLVNALVDLGRTEEAEGFFADQLAQQVTPKANRGYNEPHLVQKTLMGLAAVYHKAGRHEDVLLLLVEAPYWSMTDLAPLVAESYGYDGASLGYIVARTLAEVGRKEESVRVIDALLNFSPGLDSAYSLLVELEGQSAIAKLDLLFERDQFEERPLIWKAHLLVDAGKLAEATTTIQLAIAIDPSDGEQGKGDRMRAYAVFARIFDPHFPFDSGRFGMRFAPSP